MVVEPSLCDESEFLYAAQPELLRYKSPQLAVEMVIDWYQTRAEEIEHYAGQVRTNGSCFREDGRLTLYSLHLTAVDELVGLGIAHSS